MRPPDFWTHDDGRARLAAKMLSPLGWCYGAAVRWKAAHTEPYRARVPVICIGNLTAGGTGKTPIAIAVADALIARGKNPLFLSRGYGGCETGPVVVTREHQAKDVGDEPLLLARKAPTVVSRNRADGARLAADCGADVIIMDDGYQNFTLTKDLSLLVVDAEQGFGNGCILPAGPLRERVKDGLARADAVILSGEGTPELPPFDGPLLRARTQPCETVAWQGRRVVAFAGIGRPEKLFRSLRESGADIAAAIPFADHHPFSDNEIAGLVQQARREGAELVTTEKDYVRLSPSQRNDIVTFPVIARFDPEAGLERLLDRLWAAR